MGKLTHEPMDRHCAFWNGTRVSFLSRLVLGIRCVICSNVGATLGRGVNPPASGLSVSGSGTTPEGGA